MTDPLVTIFGYAAKASISDTKDNELDLTPYVHVDGESMVLDHEAALLAYRAWQVERHDS